ncbi:MAG: SIMPL domain-containing protein [Pedobacter sp.]|nr:SIMPL domain-containing protein [Pedobacter sp.]MDQ8053624.1 SIMPL domain-containing protein [Pedobacter sp.]
MKKLLMMATIALFSINAMAQQVDLRRKVTVSGSAETEVTPDIIYLNISLKEYLKDNNSKKKVEITELENQLYAAVVKAGIAKEDLTVNNVSSFNYVTEKKKNPDFLASKQYRLKVSDLNKWNAIIGAIDAKGISSTNIESYDYSKISSLKKELKIKALLAAKEKATYMVEALGDKLGNVIDIQEVNNEIYPQPMYRANVMMMKAESSMAADAVELDFKKIKLNYLVNAVFEIK